MKGPVKGINDNGQIKVSESHGIFIGQNKENGRLT